MEGSGLRMGYVDILECVSIGEKEVLYVMRCLGVDKSPGSGMIYPRLL